MTLAKALVLTGFGLNCDYETDYALKLAGAESHRMRINEVIAGSASDSRLDQYHILVFGGGFSLGRRSRCRRAPGVKDPKQHGRAASRFIRRRKPRHRHLQRISEARQDGSAPHLTASSIAG